MTTTIKRTSTELLELLQRGQAEFLRLAFLLDKLEDAESTNLIRITTESIVSDINRIRESSGLELFTLSDILYSQEETWDDSADYKEDLLDNDVTVDPDRIKKETTKIADEKKKSKVNIFKDKKITELQKLAKKANLTVNFKGSTLPEQQHKKYVKKLKTYYQNIESLAPLKEPVLLKVAKANAIKISWIAVYIKNGNKVTEPDFANFLSNKNLRFPNNESD